MGIHCTMFVAARKYFCKDSMVLCQILRDNGSHSYNVSLSSP